MVTPLLEETPLARAFTQDHQHLTGALARLALAVRDNDATAAHAVADELDRTAGGHMMFEEQVLYPQVARIYGPEYAAQLYAEHRVGQSVVRRIQQLPEGEWFSPDEREELLEDLRAVTGHVLSCGTLLSVVTGLPAGEQEELLSQLEEYRAAGHRWTQIGVVSRPATPSEGAAR